MMGKIQDRRFSAFNYYNTYKRIRVRLRDHEISYMLTRSTPTIKC